MLFTKYILVIFSIVLFSCQSNNAANDLRNSTNKIAKVEVYYFHQKKGCLTCKTIGELSKKFVNSKYGDKSKDVSYHDIDISIKENQFLADKFEVNWSGLYLLAHTSKGEVTDNLTEFAFMYAMTNPDTIKLVLSNKINQFLKQ